MEQKQDILIGRDAEIKHLESIASSKEAEFVVVYGRRRVGKTFLVNTFFGDKYTFKLTGLPRRANASSWQTSQYRSTDMVEAQNIRSHAHGMRRSTCFAICWNKFT